MTGVDLATVLVLGAAFSAGLLLILSSAPRWRARGLPARLAPYLRDLTDGDATSASAIVTVPIVRGPKWHDAGERMRHLAASWSRSRVVVAAATGAGVGAIAAIIIGVLQPPTAGLLAIPVLGVAVGVMCEQTLRKRASHARERRVHEELPVVLEFLALCLAAGEGLLDALRRASTRGSGDIAAGLREVVVDVGTGSSLPDALGACARTLDNAAFSRTVDQLVSAIDRGTPLAEVLHAHASDARAEDQRMLIEQAGRKEIAMLVPLVFLILPISVLFAIFPGVVMLDLG